MADNKEENSGSESEHEDDNDISDMPDAAGPPRPAPPPPRKPQGPLSPEEQLESRLKLAISKIAGPNVKGEFITKEECETMWDFEADTKLDEAMKKLLNVKFRQTAVSGNLIGMEFLLSKGAEVDGLDAATGNSALLNAVSVTQHLDRQKEVINFLMKNGANPNVKNKVGNTAKTAVAGQDSTLPVFVREQDVLSQSRC